MSGDVISLAVSVGITGQGGRIGSVFGGGGLLVTPIPESKQQKFMIISINILWGIKRLTTTAHNLQIEIKPVSIKAKTRI